MVFTLGTLFEALLLLVNAIAILNEERFLAKGECTVVLAIYLVYSSLPVSRVYIYVVLCVCDQWGGGRTIVMRGSEVRVGSRCNW